MFALCNNRFFSRNSVRRRYCRTKFSDSCFETLLLDKSAFQWANSTRPLLLLYVYAQLAIDRRENGRRKEGKKEKKDGTHSTEKRREISLHHWDIFAFFFRRRKNEKREKKTVRSRGVYVVCLCIVHDVNHVDSKFNCVYTVGPYNHSACLIGVEINLWLRGFSQKTTENLVNRKKEK